MKNVLSIDAEDWFQAGYGERLIDRRDWGRLESRIVPMVDTLLALFDEKNVYGTFFVVGWLADTHPGLIRRIHEQGHEIAGHAYWHQEIFRMDPSRFREDAVRTKHALEQAIGAPVFGFRAPAYSIRPTEDWALDILAEIGYRYDSSLLHAPAPLAEIRPGLIEIAPNAIRLGRRHLPVNGGFVFRAMPYALYRRYVGGLNRRLIFYTHTWEAFTDYPRIQLTGLKRFVQYFNINAVYPKLARLLDDFEFTSVERAFPEFGFTQHSGTTNRDLNRAGVG